MWSSEIRSRSDVVTFGANFNAKRSFNSFGLNIFSSDLSYKAVLDFQNSDFFSDILIYWYHANFVTFFINFLTFFGYWSIFRHFTHSLWAKTRRAKTFMSLAISMGSTANGRGLCDRVFQICKITCPKIGKSLHDENIPIIIKNSSYWHWTSQYRKRDLETENTLSISNSPRPLTAGLIRSAKILESTLIITNTIFIKGSSDESHFIFEINAGKSRIRHWTTLNLNDLIFCQFESLEKFNFRIVLCRIRPFPTLISKMKFWATLKIFKPTVFSVIITWMVNTQDHVVLKKWMMDGISYLGFYIGL